MSKPWEQFAPSVGLCHRCYVYQWRTGRLPMLEPCPTCGRPGLN